MLTMIYIAFISLGLPDALLGSAWPSMQPALGVPVSYAGLLSMLIALGTVASSLLSDRLTGRFGAGRVTACSVALTAAALLGFSWAESFWQLVLLTLPYGLGAGAVDAALNNYVALHYEAKHMSWLHCCWGVGAAVGPYVMGAFLTGGWGWTWAYGTIGVFQIGLTAALFLSLPGWKKPAPAEARGGKSSGSFRTLLALPGARAAMLAFFCYCSVEQTAGLWAASFMVDRRGIPEERAAAWSALFFLGITVGRLLAGFAAIRFRGRTLVEAGLVVLTGGVCLLALPVGNWAVALGLLLIGLGCAPVYPCLIHETPENFGADRSQAAMGLQMASAYVGITLMPPLFGLLAKWVGMGLLPLYLLVLTATMFLSVRKIRR